MEIIGDKAESSTTSPTSSFPPFAPTRQQAFKQTDRQTDRQVQIQLGHCYCLRIVILHHGRRRGGVRIHLQDGVCGGPFDLRLFIQNEDLAPR